MMKCSENDTVYGGYKAIVNTITKSAVYNELSSVLLSKKITTGGQKLLRNPTIIH